MNQMSSAGTWSRKLLFASSVGMFGILALLSCRSRMPNVLAQHSNGRVERGRYAGAEGTRAWRLFVPARVKTPVTMLVLLHGCLQDAADITAGSRMDVLAAEDGFVVLYPEQDVAANPRKCWNWFDIAHQSRGTGEPAIIAGMVAQVATAEGIDARRVHIAGISAGAAMSGLVSAAYPERFASVSLMSGVAWKSAMNVGRALAVMKDGARGDVRSADELVAAMGTNARAVPTLILHGENDAVLNVRNGDEAAAQTVAVHNLLRARAGLSPLRQLNKPARTEHGYLVAEQSWLNERSAPVVTYVRVGTLGHAWSGGAPAGTFTDSAGPDASRFIARFIAQHTLPVR